MTHESVDRVRGLVMFVMAWLIALYVYEVVQDAFDGPIGFVAAAFTWGINIYARKKAAASVGSNRAFKFWLYLPVILFLAVPVLVKIIVFTTSQGDLTWWEHLASLLPFMLKLGVPVAVLLWVYIAVSLITLLQCCPTAHNFPHCCKWPPRGAAVHWDVYSLKYLLQVSLLSLVLSLKNI